MRLTPAGELERGVDTSGTLRNQLLGYLMCISLGLFSNVEIGASTREGQSQLIFGVVAMFCRCIVVITSFTLGRDGVPSQDECVCARLLNGNLLFARI